MKTKTQFSIFALVLFALSSSVLASESIYGFVKATNGTAINDVNVSIKNSTGAFINNTFTNSQGFYNLTFDVNTGIYRINFTTTQFQNASVTKVIFNNNNIEINQTLQSLGPTFGTVFGIVKDVNNVTLSEANILVENTEVYSTLTNSTGEYKLDVRPGLYNITASKSGYKDEKSVVNITAGSNVNLDFIMNIKPPAILTGKIVDILNNSLVANVQLKQGETTVLTTQSDSNGNYNSTIVAGNYTITASKSGYVGSQQNVTLASGVALNVNFTLTPTGTIAGTITNGDSASIELRQGNLVKASTLANINGSYSITAGIGLYELVISKDRFQTVSQSINLTTIGITFSASLSPTPVPTPSPSPSPSPTPTPTFSPSSPNITSTPTAELKVNISENKVSIYLPIIIEYKNIPITGKVSLTNLAIELSSPIRGSEIKIEEIYETPPGIRSQANHIYSYIKIEKSNLPDEKISNINLEFKVNKTWIKDFDINESSILMQRYTNGWNKLKTEIIGSDQNYFYYRSISPGLSIFSITGEEHPIPKQIPTPSPSPSPSPTPTIASTSPPVNFTTSRNITGLIVGTIRSNYKLIILFSILMIFLFLIVKRIVNRPESVISKEKPVSKKPSKNRKRIR